MGYLVPMQLVAELVPVEYLLVLWIPIGTIASDTGTASGGSARGPLWTMSELPVLVGSPEY